jgi:photosystem II stability/assembly factor-like uncharacterized protein
MKHASCAILTVLALAVPALAAETWEPLGLCAGGSTFSLATSPVDPNVMMISSDMSEAFISEDGGRSWRMIHCSQLRACTSCSPAFDPKVRNRAIASAGRNNDLRVTTDCGKTWQTWCKEDLWKEARLTALFIDLDQPARVFVGTSIGAFVSDDDGKTFQPCGGVTGKVLGFAVDRGSPAAKRVCFVGTDGGVLRSEDGGKTFADASASGLAGKKLQSFSGGSKPPLLRLYATTPCQLADGKLAGGVFVSKDGAKTWQPCMNPDIDVQTKKVSEWAHGDLPNYVHIRTCDANPDRAYAFDAGVSYDPPNHSTVYRTDDAGGKWVATLYSDPRFGKDYNVDPDWVSKTVGQKWQDVPYSLVVNSAHPDVVALCASAYVYRTDNAGKHWRACQAAPAPEGKGWLCNGLVVTTTWNYYIDPHERNRHYLCYTDIGFAYSLDSGKSWLWGGPKLPGKWSNTTYELAVDPDVPGRVWGAFSNTHDIPNENVIRGGHRVIMQGGVGVSTDFCQSWTPSTLPQAPCMSVVLDPTSPKDSRTLWASCFEKGVYRSDDGGKTWQEKSKGLGSPDNMRTCRLERRPDGTLFVVVTGKKMKDGKFTTDGVGLYRSADKGDTWTKVTESLPLHWPKDFAVNPKDPQTILLAAAQCKFFPEEGGLYRTTDGGATWKKIVQKGPQHFGAFYHPDRPGWIYTTLTEGAPDAGLWLSKDDGATWTAFEGLPFSNIQRVTFDPADKDHIYLSTFGGSAFKGPVEPGQ